jgi:hypothetical protein
VDWPARGLRVSCGESSGGADGYVALSTLGNDTLVWIAFFSTTNPFHAVSFRNGDIVARTTMASVWTYPVDDPTRLSVVYAPPNREGTA